MKKKFTFNSIVIFFLAAIFLSLNSCSKSASTTEQPTIPPPPPPPVVLENWVVSTVAGSGQSVIGDGNGTSASFINPENISVDALGNLFVTDGATGVTAIRKISTTNDVTTYTSSNISHPYPSFAHFFGITVDSHGNIFTVDYSLIRKITPASDTLVFAGSLDISFMDGVGTAAKFNMISNLTIDKNDNLFLVDYDMTNHFRIRKITPAGMVSTLTLQDNTGVNSDGNASVWYNYPITCDSLGNIYVTASANTCIKKINPQGIVTILAGSATPGYVDDKGTNARFISIAGIASDAKGTLYVSDYVTKMIRKVTSDGNVTTLAGKAGPGYADGDTSISRFSLPAGISVAKNGLVYVADELNHRIRKLEHK